MFIHPHFRALSLSLFLAISTQAAPPAWWSAPETLILDSNPAANYSPANLGQLKLVATQAKKHLDQELKAVGGAGAEITDLVNSFTPLEGHTADSRAANYATLNLGQLKRVATPFYNRLIAVGYNTKQNLIDHKLRGWTHHYPWNPNDPWNQPGPGDKSTNYAPANLGQLKLVFSFSLAGFTVNYDADGDGVSNADEVARGLDPWSNTNTDRDTLPDDWEKFWFKDLTHEPNDIDDGGALTNRDQFDLRLNPTINEAASTTQRLNFNYDSVGSILNASGNRPTTSHVYDFGGNLTNAQ